MTGALTVSVLNLAIVAVTHPKLLADSTDSIDFNSQHSTEVSPECRLPQSRMTNSTRNCSQEFSERDRGTQHGNSYLAEGVVLPCGTHVQQPHHTYVLSKHLGNNTLQ